MTDDDVESQRRREECERKARRGEMDPRLEFAFQLLIDGTGLERHKIMDHIFEGDMVRTGRRILRPVIFFYFMSTCLAGRNQSTFPAEYA